MSASYCSERLSLGSLRPAARLASLLVLLALNTRCNGSGERNASPAATSHSADSVPSTNAPRTGVRSSVEFFPAAELTRIGNALVQQSVTARGIRDARNYHVVVARRTVTGSPEIYDFWTDVTLVQAGRAILVTEGRVDGGHVIGRGEHRGGTLVGGASRAIAQGDLFIVPAGVPHQFQLGPGDTIRYLTIKVPGATILP